MHSLKFALSSFAGISLVLRVGKLEGLDHTRYVVDYTRSDSDLFVRLDPGEEIHAALKMLADDLGFDAAAITSGIGRTRDNLYGFKNDWDNMLDNMDEIPSEANLEYYFNKNGLAKCSITDVQYFLSTYEWQVTYNKAPRSYKQLYEFVLTYLDKKKTEKSAKQHENAKIDYKYYQKKNITKC